MSYQKDAIFTIILDISLAHDIGQEITYFTVPGKLVGGKIIYICFALLGHDFTIYMLNSSNFMSIIWGRIGQE